MQPIAVSKSQLLAAIAELDARIAAGSCDVMSHLDRGQFLELLGRNDEAARGYREALRHAPANVDALNALGLLLLATGKLHEARRLFSDAVLHGPAHAAAHANLADLEAREEQLESARALYERALNLDPQLAAGHHGLAHVLHRLGDTAGAQRHRSQGLQLQPITVDRYIGDGRPIHVLVLTTERRGNIPTDGYLDNTWYLLASLTVEHALLDLPLPPHDIVFNAIGEADLCANALARAAAILQRTNAPVINHPAAIAATGRAPNACRLGQIEGVTTPRIVAVRRSDLTCSGAAALLASQGFDFPLLVRAPGYHTGDHFVQIDRPADLVAGLASLPGDDLLVIEYLDVRDSDDRYRKFRVIIVDGRLYPLHLAVSRSWKVHYFSADMAERPDHRAEDAAFLAGMRAVIGAPAVAALERICDVLRLDYGGIDFALDPSGHVIVFEANASMIVPLPEADAMWDYRREPVAQIRAAVRTMLAERAARVGVAGTS